MYVYPLASPEELQCSNAENEAVRTVGETDESKVRADELILVRNDQFRRSLRDGVKSCLRVRGRDVRLKKPRQAVKRGPNLRNTRTKTLASTTRRPTVFFTLKSGFTTPCGEPFRDMKAVLVGW